MLSLPREYQFVSHGTQDSHSYSHAEDELTIPNYKTYRKQTTTKMPGKTQEEPMAVVAFEE